MVNHEVARPLDPKDGIERRFQTVRDAVVNLVHSGGNPQVAQELIEAGNGAMTGLGLSRVRATGYETFSGEKQGWQKRWDHGIGVLQSLTGEHLVYVRDGRRFRAPVGQIEAIQREVSRDHPVRDENGRY